MLLLLQIDAVRIEVLPEHILLLLPRLDAWVATVIQSMDVK